MSKKFRWRELDSRTWSGECVGYFALINIWGAYHYARTFRKEQTDILISSVASGSLIQAKAAADLALLRDWQQPSFDFTPAEPESADERSIIGHGCPLTSPVTAGGDGAIG